MGQPALRHGVRVRLRRGRAERRALTPPRRARGRRPAARPRPRLGSEVALLPPPPAPGAAEQALVRAAPPPARSPGALARAGAALGSRLREAIDPDLARRYEYILGQMTPHGCDPFGFRIDYARYTLHAAALLYRRWFRCRTHGIQRVPPGRALLVANHSGQIPIDGMMIAAAMVLDHDPPRLVRSMVERWAATLPFVSTFFARVGQVIGIPENCRLLLEREEPILVFPEGTRGITKTFDRAYQLEEFGGGFVRLALENRTPIVPVAVVGAEEQYPTVLNLEAVGELFGSPSLPLTPLLLLGPLGLLPLPTRYYIAFGEPIWLEGDEDEDDERVAEHVHLVRSTIQDMLQRLLDARPGVFA